MASTAIFTIRGESALFDGKRLPAAIVAARGAGAMRKDGFAAFGTAHELRRRQRVVRAALVLLGLGGPSLRNRHFAFIPSFLSARAEGVMNGKLLMQLHIAENRHPRIVMRIVAAACGFVQVGAAVRAEAAAILVAQGPRRQRQQRLLANQRLEVDLLAAVKAQPQFAGVELLVLGRRRTGREN